MAMCWPAQIAGYFSRMRKQPARPFKAGLILIWNLLGAQGMVEQLKRCGRHTAAISQHSLLSGLSLVSQC